MDGWVDRKYRSQKLFKKIVSITLVIHFALINLSPIAQARIQDRDVLNQYRSFLIDLKGRFPDQSEIQNMNSDDLVEQFEREGIEGPETSELLDRMEAFLHGSDEFASFFDKFKGWYEQERGEKLALTLIHAKVDR